MPIASAAFRLRCSVQSGFVRGAISRRMTCSSSEAALILTTGGIVLHFDDNLIL